MTIFFSAKFRIFVVPLMLCVFHLFFNRHLSIHYFSAVEVFCFSMIANSISIGLEWLLNKLRFSPSFILFVSVVFPSMLIFLFLGIATYFFDFGNNFGKIQWAEVKSLETALQQLQNWYSVTSSKSVHLEIFFMTVANFLFPVFLFQMGIALIVYTFKRK
ncbi:MAG: hypothetical protein ACK5WZ_00180 [Pseudobdellovibrionaceae bacterium]